MGYVKHTLINNVSLLTIFSGLFGVSTLIYSLSQNSKVPSQNKYHNFKINNKILGEYLQEELLAVYSDFYLEWGLLRAVFWHKNSVVVAISGKIGRDFYSNEWSECIRCIIFIYCHIFNW